MSKIRRPVEVFCDGSLYSNSFGAYGVLLMFGNKSKEIESKGYKETTISRMEMKAIIHALEELSPGFSIYLYSDAKGVVDIINMKLSEWIEFGTFDERVNVGLWRRFLRAKRKHIEGGSVINFCWIRGHSGSKFNERVDKIAKKGLKIKHKVKCKDFN